MTIDFTVITAVLNRASTLPQALASVQSQEGVAVQHVVIDGGSTDGSLELLQQQGERVAVLVSEPDAGIYDALNKGLKRATGSVVGFIHSDDWFAHSQVLLNVAQAIGEPGVEGVYGNLDYISVDGARVVRRWRPGRYDPAFLAQGWMPPHPALFLRRTVYERLGGFDAEFQVSGDYEFVLRLFTEVPDPGFRRDDRREKLDSRLRGNDGSVVYLPEVLVKMRWGGASNRSAARLWQKSREDLVALRRHKVGGLGTLLLKNLSKMPQFFG